MHHLYYLSATAHDENAVKSALYRDSRPCPRNVFTLTNTRLDRLPSDTLLSSNGAWSSTYQRHARREAENTGNGEVHYIIIFNREENGYPPSARNQNQKSPLPPRTPAQGETIIQPTMWRSTMELSPRPLVLFQTAYRWYYDEGQEKSATRHNNKSRKREGGYSG